MQDIASSLFAWNRVTTCPGIVGIGVSHFPEVGGRILSMPMLSHVSFRCLPRATRRHTVGSVRIAALDHEPMVRTRDESAGGGTHAHRREIKGACELRLWLKPKRKLSLMARILERLCTCRPGKLCGPVPPPLARRGAVCLKTSTEYRCVYQQYICLYEPGLSSLL